MLRILKVNALSKDYEVEEHEGTPNHVQTVQRRHGEVDCVIVAVTRSVITHEFDLLTGHRDRPMVSIAIMFASVGGRLRITLVHFVTVMIALVLVVTVLITVMTSQVKIIKVDLMTP